MSDKKWRSDLDILVDKKLSELVKETKEYDYAISKSKDPSKAQIWVALALISHKIDLISNDKTKHEKKIPKEELSKILKTLEKL